MALLMNTLPKLCNFIHGLGDYTTIMAGLNEFDDKIWNKMKDHPSIKTRLKDGIFVHIPDGKIDANGKRSVEDMLSYIPKIYDTKLLRKIIKEDGRDRVVITAKEHLDMILDPKRSAEIQNDEHFK